LAAETTTGGRSKAAYRWLRFNLFWIAMAVAVAGLILLPLALVIDVALHRETRFGLGADYSWAAFVDVYSSAEYLVSLLQALILAGFVAAAALIVGVGISVLMARTRLPAKRLFEIMIIVPLFLSPFNGLLAWIALASPKTGLLNQMAAAVLARIGVQLPSAVNIWSFGGAIWVMFLFFTPYVYLFTSNSLRAMDSSLEEAARASGATPLRALLRITLPICLPAIFASGLLVFILTAETYTVPGIIGSNAGFTVLSWQIFVDMMQTPVHQAHAAAAGTMLLAATVIGVWIQRRITRNAERFVTMGGKGRRTTLVSLGSWKWLAVGLVGAYVVCSTVLPIGMLILSSLMKFDSPSLARNAFTLQNYRDFATVPNTRGAVGNTLLLALATGVLCVLIGFVISFGEVRLKRALPRLLALLCVLPVAIPGLIYGIGVRWVYLRTPLYGTLTVMLLAFLAKFIPYGVLMSRSGILQIHPELEQCARTCGAGPVRVLARITAPLISTTLVTILFFVMLLSIKELSASVVLYSERSEVLSVLTWAYTDQGSYQFAAAIGVVQTFVMLLLVLGVRMVFNVKLEGSIGEGTG
jgi:iron(III) transport system permease protein